MLVQKDEEKKEEEVNAGLGRILSLNASEMPFILIGCFASLINGGTMPAFAIIFAEILGVGWKMQCIMGHKGGIPAVHYGT